MCAHRPVFIALEILGTNGVMFHLPTWENRRIFIQSKQREEELRPSNHPNKDNVRLGANTITEEV